MRQPRRQDRRDTNLVQRSRSQTWSLRSAAARRANKAALATATRERPAVDDRRRLGASADVAHSRDGAEREFSRYLVEQEERAARTTTQLTMVIPTRNELGNIAELVTRLEKCVPVPLEIIFVDDSDDGTPAAIDAIGKQAECAVRLIHRPAEQRLGGLGGAVIEGIRAARSPQICVMDADLQHPPELVPSLLEAAERGESNLVVASRYNGHGDAKGLNPLRAAVSQGTTTVARATFPRRLARVSDPMSGFFMIRKDALDLNTFEPCGFKILMEIVVRTPGLRISEVGFEFGKRHAGESKAGLKEGIRFFKLLGMLRFGQDSLRFAQFLGVGASGILVNTLFFALFAGMLSLGAATVGVAAVLATQASTLWNFLLTDHWVYGSRQHGRARSARMAMYFAMNNVASLLRVPMIYGLVALFGGHSVVANLISLVAMTFLRYAMADMWIWRRAAVTDTQDASPITEGEDMAPVEADEPRDGGLHFELAGVRTTMNSEYGER